MKRLKEVEQEQEAIRARLEELNALPGPDGDEIARAKVFEDRGNETDDLLSRWDELETERVPLVARAQRLEAIRVKALEERNTESGDGAAPTREKYLGERGP